MLKKIATWLLGGLGFILLLSVIIAATQKHKAEKRYSVRAERKVAATQETVWKVISDIKNYHKVTGPGIEKVEILSGEGLNMKRACYSPKGERWEEICTAWIPNSHFTFLVDTEAEDYPFPLNHLQGTWGVEAIDSTHSKIFLDFEYQLSSPWLMWPFVGATNELFEEGNEALLNTWQEMVED